MDFETTPSVVRPCMSSKFVTRHLRSDCKFSRSLSLYIYIYANTHKPLRDNDVITSIYFILYLLFVCKKLLKKSKLHFWYYINTNIPICMSSNEITQITLFFTANLYYNSKLFINSVKINSFIYIYYYILFPFFK